MPENREQELIKKYTETNAMEKMLVSMIAIAILASIFLSLPQHPVYKTISAVLRLVALGLVIMTFLIVKCPNCGKYPGGGFIRKSCRKCGCRFH
jgi:hypothetical protein